MRLPTGGPGPQVWSRIAERLRAVCKIWIMKFFFQLSSWLIFAFIVLAVVYKSVKFCDKFPDYC